MTIYIQQIVPGLEEFMEPKAELQQPMPSVKQLPPPPAEVSVDKDLKDLTAEDVQQVEDAPEEESNTEQSILPAKHLPPPIQVSNNKGLRDEDVQRVEEALDTEQADNTKKAYASGTARFKRWCECRGITHLPADPDHVVAYFAEAAQDLKMSTVKLHRTAISDAHRQAGLTDPTKAAIVRKVVRGLSKKYKFTEGQAKGLTAADMENIRATASKPRRTTGNSNRVEPAHKAEARGLLDIAICSVMRDGLLRRAEAAELRWKDLEIQTDGTSRITIRFSKTDQEGEGVTLFLSEVTTEDLMAIMPDTMDPEELIFGLSADAINRHIRKTCVNAHLGDGYSGHSGRVGMAQDLSDAGATTSELMTAGRWKSSIMVGKYCRNQQAGRGAVSKFHDGKYRHSPESP